MNEAEPNFEFDLIEVASELRRTIVGGLKHAIGDHGPITHENLSSAEKRIIAAIKVLNRRRRRQNDHECNET